MKHGVVTFLFCLLIVLSSSRLKLYAQFEHTITEDKKPWTFEPKISDDNFRFVIIGDLTGGEELGVFESAIEKINQISPDFVMCVGDLIEGYTFDSATINNQWNSFQNRLKKLNAPFFHLPGNHDFSNSKLAEEWLNRLGRDYYSFTVNHSLFLMINMFEPGEEGISKEQVNYLKKALLAHNKDFPVYVFSHAPLWKNWKKEGYNKLDSLINSYNTTFFCGHEHHYIFKEDRGHQHYMLAKTGGGFENVNVNLGEFDHFLWVTANDNGHSVANILLDGVISTRIVDSSTESQVNILRSENWFKIKPTVTQNNNVATVQSQISLFNHGDYPLFVEGKFSLNEKFAFLPKTISEIILVGGKVNIPIEIQSLTNCTVETWPEIILKLEALFRQNSRELKASSEKRWIIDSQKKCTNISEKNEPIICLKPEVVEESWCWSGIEDGSFRFSSTYDKEYIYIHIETIDDTLIINSLDPESIQDKLIVHFYADTLLSKRDFYEFQFTAGNNVAINAPVGKSVDGIIGSCNNYGETLEANLKIPKNYLKNDFFRLNIGFIDHDDPTSIEPSVIWWKPKWGSRSDYAKSGVFLVEDKKN